MNTKINGSQETVIKMVEGFFKRLLAFGMDLILQITYAYASSLRNKKIKRKSKKSHQAVEIQSFCSVLLQESARFCKNSKFGDILTIYRHCTASNTRVIYPYDLYCSVLNGKS